MEPRLAFLIGVVVTQVFNQRPVQLDQAELILLKNEIAHTPRFVGRVSYHPGGVQVEREGSGSRHSGKPDF